MTITMPNWFYYDETGTRTGPVTVERLKLLVNIGTIKPETVVETEGGQQAYAKNVRGLFNATEPATKRMESPPPPPPLREKKTEPRVKSLSSSGHTTARPSAAPVPTFWYYYDAADQKVGPFAWSTLQSLARHGIIQPETAIVSDTTPRQLARHFTGADGLIFLSPDKKAPPEPEPKVIYVERQPEQPPVDMGCGCVGCLIFILLFFLMVAASAACCTG